MLDFLLAFLDIQSKIFIKLTIQNDSFYHVINKAHETAEKKQCKAQ